MKLEEIMVRNVVEAAPDDTIGAAAKRMREKNVGCLVATVDGRVKGIITDRDLLACLERRHDPDRCKVAAHMSRPVTVLPPDEDRGTAARVLAAKRIKRLPIAQKGKLLGIISLSDLAALAHAEAVRMGPACGFIIEVVGAGLRQGKVRTEAPPAEPALGAPAPRAESNNRVEAVEAGGPG